jgi:uncharacterized membrane protein (UPF0127 family)
MIVHEATGFRARLLGLAFRREPPGYALLLRRCRSVHTFGMRFPLDIVFLDERGSPLKFAWDVPPRRVLHCRGASAVLEAPSRESGIRYAFPE